MIQRTTNTKLSFYVVLAIKLKWRRSAEKYFFFNLCALPHDAARIVTTDPHISFYLHKLIELIIYFCIILYLPLYLCECTHHIVALLCVLYYPTTIITTTKQTIQNTNTSGGISKPKQPKSVIGFFRRESCGSGGGSRGDTEAGSDPSLAASLMSSCGAVDRPPTKRSASICTAGISEGHSGPFPITASHRRNTRRGSMLELSGWVLSTCRLIQEACRFLHDCFLFACFFCTLFFKWVKYYLKFYRPNNMIRHFKTNCN